MPVKIKFKSGKVLVLNDGNLSCEEDPFLAEEMKDLCGSVGAEVPDPDMYRAEIIQTFMEGCELFDYEPFNMQRDRPGAVY